MILSCSRRTDIPAFFSEWLMHRLEAGYAYVENPYNPNQVSKVNLSPEVVDCIVFWSKNPRPMLQYLDQLDALGYKYYFQFTITPYSSDLEKNGLNKSELIQTFIELSERIGKEKVILRYDPILLTKKYDMNYHERAFKRLCDQLGAYTDKVIISFVDAYSRNKAQLDEAGISELSRSQMRTISKRIQGLAEPHHLIVESCAESIDLSDLGIEHGYCIDGGLIERIIGCKLQNKDKKDSNRALCGCMKSIDIGTYSTCLHGCIYCYANGKAGQVKGNIAKHNPNSELLVGELEGRVVTERKDAKSYKVKMANEQMKLF